MTIKDLLVFVLIAGVLGQAWYIWSLKNNSVLLPPLPPVPSMSISDKETDAEKVSDTDEVIIDAYKSSVFKVVTVVPNTFDKSNFSSLYVVTKSGVNDQECGGQHSAGSCFFFIESPYHPVRYIGMWRGEPTSMTSARFIDKTTVRFEANGADAGHSAYDVWELNTETGSTTRISRETFEPN